MPAAQHTVSIAFVRSAVRALDVPLRSRVLAVAGIGAESLTVPNSRVPAAAFAALWMAVARELDDEFFGLDARRMKVGSFALLCGAVASQPNLERALQSTLRGFALLLDDIDARLVVDGPEALVVVANRIRADDDAEAADARRFADETLLVMVHGMMCWLADRRVPLLRLDWAHPEPSHAGEYRRMFSADLRFGRPATAISFDARLLRAKVSVSAAGLRGFLRDAPQSVFLKQVAAAGWGERVQRRLRRTLAAHSDVVTLHDLAAAFGVSPATLRRRLDSEGTSWQQLKDDMRRELAIQHLADPGLSIEQVAQRLGFTDASSFHRAFRKWTGAAPGAYRNNRATTAMMARPT